MALLPKIIFGIASPIVPSVMRITKNIETKSKIDEAQKRHNQNIACLETAKEKTEEVISSYEKEVSKIRDSFVLFSDLIAELQNRPQFKPYSTYEITLPEVSISEMKHSPSIPLVIGTGILFGTTSLLGMVISSIVSYSLSTKADEVWDEMRKCEKQITKINQYLGDLRKCIQDYKKVLKQVSALYYPRLYTLERILHQDQRRNWFSFTPEEQTMVENLACLVSLLNQMTKAGFLGEEGEDGLKKIDRTDTTIMTEVATDFINSRQWT